MADRTEQTNRERPETRADTEQVPRWRRLLWHAAATAALVAVVWWAFQWQLSALQWVGLLLIAIVLWHALQGRGRMRRRTRWIVSAAAFVALAATLPVDQPWKAHWWPGSPLTGSVPDPCAVAADHLPRLLGTPGAPAEGGYRDLATDWRTCGWADEDRLLYLEFRRYPWQGTNDKAIAAAEHAFTERRDHAAAEPLALGDEAYADPLEDTRLTIESRRANVIVTVRYYAQDDAAPLTEAERTALTELAETATAAAG